MIPYILLPHDSGLYILCFRLWRLRFAWFTDCGEWFIYLIWNGKNHHRTFRLSSAGCYYQNIDK